MSADLVDAGQVVVDSGQILIVDAGSIPAELLNALTSPNGYGVTVGTVVQTPNGDGIFPVVIDELGDVVILAGPA